MFLLLTIMHNAAMNVCVPVFVQTYVFTSLGHMRRNGIAESCGSSVFNLLKCCRTIFQGGWLYLSFIAEDPHFLYPKREKNQLELFCYSIRMTCIN